MLSLRRRSLSMRECHIRPGGVWVTPGGQKKMTLWLGPGSGMWPSTLITCFFGLGPKGGDVLVYGFNVLWVIDHYKPS